MEFKIDTGADANILCEDAFHKLTPPRTLEPADIPLDSPGGELLCLGRFNATVSYKGNVNSSKTKPEISSVAEL